jgi:hypothetical protein
MEGDAFSRHRNRVMEELEAAGVSRYARSTRAARHLPYIIHADEHIEAAVSGRELVMGAAMLISTDRRVIFIVKRILFLRDDEIGFKSIRGVSRMNTLLLSSLVLHTQMGDYSVKTLNAKCVEAFMKSIEQHGLEGAGL